jgi:molybdopterin/thiamine biosynthesis adenylyltransferase
MTATKTVTIVGVGALGAHVVQFLRNEAQAIRIVDFDRVEAKNTMSQFHGKPGLGKLKVDALKSVMQFLWGSHTSIGTISNKLTADNADVLLGGIHRGDAKQSRKSDLIIDCVDNGATRRLIQAYVREHKIPCLHGALAADGGYGRSIWDEQFVVDDEDGAGAPTCEDGEHLPMIALVSAYIARSAQTFLRESKRVGFSISPAGAIVV